MYAGTTDKLLVLEDAKRAKQAVTSTSEFLTLEGVGHSEFHFINDQSYYDGIIKRLDEYNGYSVVPLKPEELAPSVQPTPVVPEKN